MISSHQISACRILALLAVLLTGCASVQFDNYLEDPAIQPVVAEGSGIHPKRRASVTVPDFPAKSGWNRVTYQGEVVFSQGPGGPVPRARVALVEGTEELCSTVADEHGFFELTCDLYGKPFTSEEGVCRWCPEEYYALIATGHDGGKGKVLLRDTHYGKLVRIPLD